MVALGVPYALLLITLALGQLLRLPVLSSEVKSAPLLGIDIAVGILWFSVLVRIGLRSDYPTSGWVTNAAAAFSVWSLIGTIFTTERYDLTASQFLFSTAYLARWMFYFGVYLWATMQFSNLETLRGGATRLRAAILVIAIFGLVQSVLLPDFALTLHPTAVPYETWDPQGRRLVSTLLDPNFAGNLIGMGLLLTFPSAVRRPMFVPIPLIVLLIAFFLTGSRGALLGLLAGGLVLILALRPPALYRLVIRLAVAFLMAIVIASAVSWILGAPGLLDAAVAFLRTYNKLRLVDPSALTRLIQWKTDLDVFAANPVTGIGFNTWGFVQRYFGFYRTDTAAFGMDGGLLVIAALTGVVGVLLFTTLLAAPIIRGFKLARRPDLPEWMRDLGSSVAGCTVLWVVQGFFAATLTYPFLLAVVWLLWAWTDIAWHEVAVPLHRPRADEPSS